MRRVLQRSIFVVIFSGTVAFAQQGQQQVQPTPNAPTPLLLGPNQTACLVACDTQVMNCRNSCVVAGPITAVNPAGNAPCVLSCSTQSLVCKQACNRTQ